MNVYAKLNEARQKFHKLKLSKTGHNKFAGYNYFELGDFLIPALGVFEEVGLCAVVSFEKETARMDIFDASLPAREPNNERITITSPMGSAALKGCHEVQNIGAVETYQRRYLWTAALEIVEHDALDATTGKDAPKSTAREAALQTKISDEQQRAIESLGADIVAAWQDGQEAAVLAAWRSVTDNDERIHLWSWLSSESKLRSFLKANRETK